VEGRGRLFRFDLATRQPTLIDTAFANRNNNDHVLSFDGTMLAISDQSQGDNKSTVYTVPVQGGTPKRITPVGPSYLHGWSPDGKFLVYTGGRDNEFEIYRIPSDGGGPEVNLTKSKGLDDGPEYSPDGRYVYFNSAAQRHHADLAHGRGRVASAAGHERRVQQLVPAPLADGQWIAFLSFPKDVSPPTIRTTSGCTCGSCPRAAASRA
jgi:Tol biopolymer transport system component